MTEKKYLFGPVPSRRFGRSLGVDLTPYKTCSLDCVFCQLGRTTKKTVLRREYVPIDEVLQELDAWLREDGHADYITLSGSGEPTLHARFGDVLTFVRNHSSIPAVLLTNGTQLHLPEVRKAASLAHVVKVSLSAWDQASYGWVNRPHPELTFDELLEGQKAFRAEFNGTLWMEVFLVAGMNALPEEVARIAALAEAVSPDRIQLNTAVRPPAESFVGPLSKEKLASLCPLFRPTAEVIAEFSSKTEAGLKAGKEAVLAMLRRRPCTSDQIARVFDMHLNEVAKYIGNLLRTGRIHEIRENGDVYYTAHKEGSAALSGSEKPVGSVSPGNGGA